MFRTFFTFELRSWLKAPLPWIFLFLFALMTFFATVTDNLQIGGSFGNINKNAPFVIQNWYAVFSILSLLLLTAFMNTAAIRDFENKTAQIVFSSPINKAGYYFGHFFGALLFSLIPMLGVSLGMWLGVGVNSLTGWVEAERFGPFEIQGHIDAFTSIVIPNAIFGGGIIFTIAALTRSTLYSFISAMALLVAYIVSGNVVGDLDQEGLAALLDPFGLRPFSIITKYWTVDDKNTLSVGLFHPGWIGNRLLWTAVGLGVLMLGYFRFSFAEKKQTKKKKKADKQNEVYGVKSLGEIPRVQQQVNGGIVWSQFFSQLKANFWGIVKSVPFIMLALLGLLNLLGGLMYSTDAYGTHNFPVTYTMVEIVRSNFYLFVIGIMAYYSGLLVWRERRAGINEIYDTMPTRNWTDMAAKFFSIVGVIALLIALGLIGAVITQAVQGFTRFEIGVYLRELLVIDLLAFAFYIALFLLVHALSPNMYLGFFLCIVLAIANAFVWDALRVGTNMVQVAKIPGYTLSDFYGYQPYAKGLFWFNAYWSFFSLIVAVLAVCFWPRGLETKLAKRWKVARQQWKRYRTPGFIAIGLWVLCGGWVYYNTFVLNTFTNAKQQEKLSVRYEKDYKKYEGKPQPRIYDIKYDIRIFPDTRAVEADGRYWVRNKHDHPLDTLFVITPTRIDFAFETKRLKLLKEDQDVNFNIYRIDPALQPGDSMSIAFSSSYDATGFENSLSVEQIMPNGTFFNNNHITPRFGYQPNRELSNKNRRKKYGLPEKTRAPRLNPQDTFARRNSYIADDSDWLNVETVISTSADQIAIAPGSLREEWTENGRNYYRYELDNPSLNFYSFMSARYEVAREKKNGIDFEVYYHPEHEANVDRMLRAMQKSLEYYTENFGPYYHKQCRIIEFPRYAQFAQAFPGTMPYSEGIGFIENYQEEEDDIDMVFYVVAHEMGHQYWGHQACGAYMQGGEMTVETFAQYSALMVMEEEYGRDIMRKFLEFEADRYLRGRGGERRREWPLARCENQGYIHYNKGSLVMYYLREMIGEENVNQALRAYLEEFRYAPPPYPVSTDVVDEFDKQTPDSLKYIIDDLFWDITLFENRTLETDVKELDNGKFEVTIKTESHKLKADGQGKEKEVAINDWIDIGAFAKPLKEKKYGKTLYRKRVKIDQANNTFTFVVDEKPHSAGIDPFSLLVDRNPEDNVREF